MQAENLSHLSGTDISKFSNNSPHYRFSPEFLIDAVSKFARIGLYQCSYFVRVHLAEKVTKTKFHQFDCCLFEVAMINMKAPKWGWQNNVCQYLEEGNWSE